MSGEAPLPSSAFGIPYKPPSGPAGPDGQVEHMNRLEQACKNSDDDELCDELEYLDSLVIDPPDSLSSEDLRYYTTCLGKFRDEWVKRCYGGEAVTVAKEEVQDTPLNDFASARADRQEYNDELSAEMPQETQRAIAEYSQHLEQEISRQEGAYSDSSRLNDAGAKLPNNPLPATKVPCPSASGSASGQGEVLHATGDGESASAAQEEAADAVGDMKKKVQQEAPNVQQDENPPILTCENLPACGHPDGNGKIWYCDQLVTGVRLSHRRGIVDNPSTLKGDAWGAGQVGYAAFGTDVSVTWEILGEKLTKVGVAAKGISKEVGTAVGGVGLGLGLADLVICIRRWRKTSERVKALDDFLQTYTFAEGDTGKTEKQIAEYAFKKKKLKRTRTVVTGGVTVTGLVTTGTGVILGLALTNPVGWVVALGLGLPAVLGGLGVYAYQGWRYRKRRRRADLQRSHLMDCRYKRRGTRHQASRVIQRISDTEPNVNLDTKKKVKHALKIYTRQQETGQRQAMASVIVAKFFDEVFDPEQGDEDVIRITEANIRNCFAGFLLRKLNMEPLAMQGELLAAAGHDHSKRRNLECKKMFQKWVQKVMGKLKSW